MTEDEVKVTENPTNELIQVKIRYDLEYTDLLKTNLAAFVKGQETKEELDKLEETVGKNIKETLLNQNPEYQILEEKGLI